MEKNVAEINVNKQWTLTSTSPTHMKKVKKEMKTENDEELLNQNKKGDNSIA